MLLIGYGNPGRGDDGLGPAFAARVAERNLPGMTVLTDYQLTVDHALMIAEAPQVVFVDALLDAEVPFRFSPVRPAHIHDLSSHSLSAAAVLALAATLYDASPLAYLLGISGVDFGEVKEGLGNEATRNMGLAEAFFLDWLGEPAFADVRRTVHA